MTGRGNAGKRPTVSMGFENTATLAVDDHQPRHVLSRSSRNQTAKTCIGFLEHVIRMASRRTA